MNKLLKFFIIFFSFVVGGVIVFSASGMMWGTDAAGFFVGMVLFWGASICAIVTWG